MLEPRCFGLFLLAPIGSLMGLIAVVILPPDCRDRGPGVAGFAFGFLESDGETLRSQDSPPVLLVCTTKSSHDVSELLLEPHRLWKVWRTKDSAEWTSEEVRALLGLYIQGRTAETMNERPPVCEASLEEKKEVAPFGPSWAAVAEGIWGASREGGGLYGRGSSVPAITVAVCREAAVNVIRQRAASVELSHSGEGDRGSASELSQRLKKAEHGSVHLTPADLLNVLEILVQFRTSSSPSCIAIALFGGKRKIRDSDLAQGSCDQFCKLRAKRGDNTFTGFGTVVGTAPNCNASCDADCDHRVCEPWIDGERCLRGHKVCCCAATRWHEQTHSPSASIFPIGAVVTRDVLRASVENLDTKVIHDLLIDTVTRFLTGRKLLGDEIAPVYMVVRTVSILHLDVEGVMMDVQGVDEMGLAVQFGMEGTAEILVRGPRETKCEGEVTVVVRSLMVFIRFAFTDHTSGASAPFKTEVHVSGQEIRLGLDRDGWGSWGSVCAPMVDSVGRIAGGLALEGISRAVKRQWAAMSTLIEKHSAKKLLNIPTVDGMRVDASTRMLGDSGEFSGFYSDVLRRSVWVGVTLREKNPSGRCAGWQGGNECALQIRQELHLAKGALNAGFMLHDWQVSNFLCELAQKEGILYSEELGEWGSSGFWSALVGDPWHEEFEDPVSVELTLLEEPEPKLSTSYDESLLYLSVGIRFRGREKGALHGVTVDLCTMGVAVVFRVHFALESGKLTTRLETHSVEGAKVVDSRVGGLVVLGTLILSLQWVVLELPGVLSFLQSLLPSFALPAYLSMSDAPLKGGHECLFAVTEARLDLQTLLRETSLATGSAERRSLASASEPDSDPATEVPSSGTDFDSALNTIL
uniref:Uncharacterized protein n=1 Tax=Chromera velia CCMP2878 TaxID=1169474 RepID=A0A0G4FPR5_9ALVE|eukprot:Cvel_3585.t1-p1 / transcript=Cvel_3585.t1 / gene=Cvel_3585 / organism=Chromera_velia_CCMP2878 / gene_product=hypothetical protein / transcript_product=hypothetical protein / location=Cvel_scaffold146:120308-125649(-) / protein_length=863 / sequence_SO=supercontig / SO=protein_coding / is_pseudo=false